MCQMAGLTLTAMSSPQYTPRYTLPYVPLPSSGPSSRPPNSFGTIAGTSEESAAPSVMITLRQKEPYGVELNLEHMAEHFTKHQMTWMPTTQQHGEHEDRVFTSGRLLLDLDDND